MRMKGEGAVLRYFLGFIGVLAALGILAGFGGTLHPAGDSLALLRPVLALVCLCIFVFVGVRWLRWCMGAAVLGAGLTVLPVFAGQTTDGDLRLYAKNIWWGNEDFALIADDIIAAEVDVVMLQEVSDRNAGVLDLLRPEFPYQHVCRYSRWNALAVLARAPFDGAPICSDNRAVALAPINVNGTTVWATSVHVPWPWPYKSADNQAEAERILSELDAPIVLAGDFNSFPWTVRVSGIAGKSQTTLAGPTRPTLTLWRMPIPIDHVLAPKGGSVTRRPLLGSDHRGLVADVDLGL